MNADKWEENCRGSDIWQVMDKFNCQVKFNCFKVKMYKIRNQKSASKGKSKTSWFYW